jgi:hypothetical protein
MKKQEHVRITREIVKRKNAEIQNLKEVMQSEIEFWQNEAEFWSSTVIKCQDQIELALAELKECSQNETLIANLTKAIIYQGK